MVRRCATSSSCTPRTCVRHADGEQIPSRVAPSPHLWGKPTNYTRQLDTCYSLTIVLHTRLSFADDLPCEVRLRCDCGAYLRLDIPRILETDAQVQEPFLRSNGILSHEHVFYTDTDVSAAS